MPNGDPLILGKLNQCTNTTGWDVKGGEDGHGLHISGKTGLVAQGNRWYGVYCTGEDTGIVAIGKQAGHFQGDVVVYGNFTVYGSKSAAVRHPDGSHRSLYAMESPECWFEDFGNAKLVRGKAKVRLDRDFAALVRTDNYQVFLTPEGDSQGLYIKGKNKSGFEVREQQTGKNSIAFSYRVVAKRKDIPGPRLPKVKMPEITDPTKGEKRPRPEPST